jgi:ribonuclease HI
VLRRVGGTSFLPRTEELISMPRMKDWLKLLNMSASQSHFGCYAPACRTEKWLHRYAFMDNAGSRWWPYLGGVYIVQAIKRVKGMRLIGPAWTRKTAATRWCRRRTKEESSRMDKVEIFTDGACKGNPGLGGWGALLVAGEAEKEIFGGARDTTNNRMELQAVIEALRRSSGRARWCCTDSQYVQKGISEWIHGWKARGWKTSTKEPVKNEDLWKALDAAQRCTPWNGAGCAATTAIPATSAPTCWPTAAWKARAGGLLYLLLKQSITDHYASNRTRY